MASTTAEWPGYPVTPRELAELGFQPLTLVVVQDPVDLREGVGIAWDTQGNVPKAPGTYVFTVSEGKRWVVTYAGQTQHLWMVTRGRRPGGASRPGNRYGRPDWAGRTRRRINVLVAEQIRAGRTVTQWVRAVTPPPGQLTVVLNREEEQWIQRWHLRDCGWNRR